MPISFGVLARKLKTIVVVLVGLGLASCSSTREQPQALTVKADKPFVAGGSIEMQLESGDYNLRAAPDDHVRVSLGGNVGNAVADLTADGTHANLAIKDTPHNNFQATIEVPSTADLVIHLAAGNLAIAAIKGNKEIDSKAGNVEISIANPNDYGSVNASVKVGNLTAGPFGESSSGLSPQLKWSGPGTYTLRANLGAGNLELKH